MDPQIRELGLGLGSGLGLGLRGILAVRNGLPENRKSLQITANQHNVILKPLQITGIYRVAQKIGTIAHLFNFAADHRRSA